MKVGILFGGPSREREISFAGGRTVYDMLDRSLFEPVPLFVDSHLNFILLDWKYIYKGSIRDFYPPAGLLPPSSHRFRIYLESLGKLSAAQQDAVIRQVGSKVKPEELPNLIDIAFLALHGAYGEDGQIQKQLAALGIPYTGSGAQACQIGADKALMKKLMGVRNFARPKMMALYREEWVQGKASGYYQEAVEKVGFPMAIRPAGQGAAVGQSALEETAGLEGFELAVNRAFFREILPVYEWKDRSKFERSEYVHLITDIREGLGFPVEATCQGEKQTLYHPEGLLDYLNKKASEESAGAAFILESHHLEEKVLIEAYAEGKEFSCLVIRNEGGAATALPPTEIIRDSHVFDYSFRYMLGLSQKVTPIGLPEPQIEAIRKECERLFEELGFEVYARIDGVFSQDEQILLSGLKTTTAMLPSSFIFHQAAEIGLNGTQFLTYILHTSLQARLSENPEEEKLRRLLEQLEQEMAEARVSATTKRRIGVLFGGNSFERHLSVQTGRNVFEKLAASAQYEPIPIFLNTLDEGYELYQLPLSLMLTDNADEIRAKLQSARAHPVVQAIRQECAGLRARYGSPGFQFEPRKRSNDELAQWLDGAFIALHGRPGEDGQVQEELEKRGIPYNGSGPQSSAVTINKYQTLQTLKRNGFTVANQLLMRREAYEQNPADFYKRVENQLAYPLVAKPVDDGSSSAVKILRERAELEAYTRLMFRPSDENGQEARRVLRLKAGEEFPRKPEILFENRVAARGARQFLEVTVGLLTHYQENGAIRYEIFEPSELLASGEVPSLEDKFFAGEEQHVTPARFSGNPEENKAIASQVRQQIERAARILNIQGYARLDAFVRIYSDNSVECLLIEANSLPALTPAASLFQQAAIQGYSPFAFIDKIISFGFERQAQKWRPVLPEKEAAIPVDPIRLPKSPPVPVLQKTEEEYLPANPPGDKAPAPSGGLRQQPFRQYLLERIRELGMELWQFLSSPIFLRNFGAIVALLFVIFFFSTLLLRLYTHHGESLQVPNYVGMDLKDAERQARRQGFKVVVIDSFFNSGERPNAIFQQDPKPLQRAKKGRTVYVSKYRVTPDSVVLPTLVSAGYNYAQYAVKLRRMDIKTTIQEKVFDSKQEENTILHFFHKGKKITDEMLRRGVKVPKGATLDFVVTERITGTVAIPDLICQRYDAAIFLIEGSNLSLGEVYGDVAYREGAFVYKQEPEYVPGMQMSIDQRVNIYLTATRPAGCPEELDPSTLDGSNGGGTDIQENEDFQ